MKSTKPWSRSSTIISSGFTTTCSSLATTAENTRNKNSSSNNNKKCEFATLKIDPKSSCSEEDWCRQVVGEAEAFAENLAKGACFGKRNKVLAQEINKQAKQLYCRYTLRFFLLYRLDSF